MINNLELNNVINEVKLVNGIKKEFVDELYNVLIKGLFLMKCKYSDRDNTILTVFPYENFEEYFEDNKSWFVVKFSESKFLFAAIFRNFINSQLTCITKKSDNEEMKWVIEDLVRNEIDKNIVELMEIVKNKTPFLYSKIEELNKK